MDNLQTTTPARTMWRPLGFGEILDRAVTLFFQNIKGFATIALVLAIPMGIFEFVADGLQPTSTSFLDQLQRQSAAPTLKSFPWLEAMMKNPAEIAAIVLVALIGLFLLSVLQVFVNTTAAIGVARIYAGKQVEFRSCYEAVLRRWLPLIGGMLMCALIYVGAILALAIVVGIPIGLIAFTGGAGGTILLLVLIGIPAVIALTLCAIVLITGFNFALYAIVIEDARVMEGISSGIRRAFSGIYFWRIVGMVLCVSLITGIVAAIAAGVGAAAVTLGWNWLDATVKAVIELGIVPFTAITYAILYYDIRIRTEGLDLEASVERLIAGDAAPT